MAAIRKTAGCIGRSTLLSAGTALLVLLTSCSSQRTYDRVPTTGRFSGEPRMVALAPNTFFFFQPDHHEKFSFTTHQRNDPALKRQGGRGKYRRKEFRIVPEEMITSGASIPRSLWYAPGFAPFDYTRAALIHDWLFEAHQRYVMAEAAFKAAQSRHDTAAMKRSLADKEAYKQYACLSQEDAADIFAECIKVAMIQSQDIVTALDQFPKRKADPAHPSPEALQELKAALRYNRPNSRTLWAYHYFVSPDAITKTSKRIWEKESRTLETYRFLTDPAVKDVALEKGYLSRWLIEKLEKILKREQNRYKDFQRAEPHVAPLQTAQVEAGLTATVRE